MQEKITKAIEEASKLVEKSKIQDPEFRKIAFAKAVDFFLLGEGETKSPTSAAERPAPDVASGDFWTDLSSAAGIDIQALKDIYSFKDGKVCLIISRVKGTKKNDQQRYLSALIVFAYHEGQKLEWIPSSFLAEAAKHSNLYSTSNFSDNVSSSNWFRTSGVRKGLQYKLSAAGLAEARSYLKELSTMNNE